VSIRNLAQQTPLKAAVLLDPVKVFGRAAFSGSWGLSVVPQMIAFITGAKGVEVSCHAIWKNIRPSFHRSTSVAVFPGFQHGLLISSRATARLAIWEH
jgi:hypothetical protein